MADAIRPTPFWNYDTLDDLSAGAIESAGARIGDYGTVKTTTNASGGATLPGISGVYEATSSAGGGVFNWVLVSDLKFSDATISAPGTYTVPLGEIVLVGSTTPIIETPNGPLRKDDRFGVCLTFSSFSIDFECQHITQSPDDPTMFFPVGTNTIAANGNFQIIIWRWDADESEWRIQSISARAGGASGDRWDETLVAGPNTNGSTAYVTGDAEGGSDRLAFSYFDPGGAPEDPPRPNPLGDDDFDPVFAWEEQRQEDITAGATGFFNIGNPLHTWRSNADERNYIRLSATCARHEGTDMSGPAGAVDMGVLDQIWRYIAPTWTLIETVHSSPAISGIFQYLGSGDSISLQGAYTLGDQFHYRARIQVVMMEGYQAGG